MALNGKVGNQVKTWSNMKVLFISDTIINIDRGGISQTLYNLFSFIAPEDIMCVGSQHELEVFPASEPFANRYIAYQFEKIFVRGNRFSKYINPFIRWFNFSYNWNISNFKNIKKQIDDFNADVVISCPNGPVGVLMHNKLTKGITAKKVFPYFMDDWMYNMKFDWLGGELHQSIKEMLSNSKSWIMISNDLSDILKERYQTQPENVLEVHNPINLDDAPKSTLLTQKDEYTFAYAGSLWPMHFDSFFIVAQSIKKLKATRRVKLIVYTSDDFWNWRKGDLEPLDVVYGGNIPYNEIHKKLNEADVLILVSSF